MLRPPRESDSPTFLADGIVRLRRDIHLGPLNVEGEAFVWSGACSAQRDDLHQEQRPRRLDLLDEYADAPDDPALRPVTEAGGGVAEGFEAAEAALVALATHATDAGGDPLSDAFRDEADAGAARVVYGDADSAQARDAEGLDR